TLPATKARSPPAWPTSSTAAGRCERLAKPTHASYPFQVLDQVALLRAAETEIEMLVVVVDDVAQRGETTIVIEAALLVRPQASKRRGAVHVGRRAIGLEGVDADLRGRMQVVPRLGEQRRDVAARALGRSVEERLAALGCGFVV